jgi:GR25 family glycosyltransferase involved in LPS biosynthesis
MVIESNFITLNRDDLSRSRPFFEEFAYHQLNARISPGVSVSAYSEIDPYISVYGQHNFTHGRKTHEHSNTLGEFGCFLAHVNIWRRAIANKTNMIIVEDGTYKFCRESIGSIVEYLKTEEDTIDYLCMHHFQLYSYGNTEEKVPHPIVPNIYNISVPTFSAKFYYISHRLAQHLVERFEADGIEFQLDWFIEQEILYGTHHFKETSYITSVNLASVRSVHECKHVPLRVYTAIRSSAFAYTIVVLLSIVLFIVVLYFQTKKS